MLTGRTALFAILAHPVDHVRAPEFYNPFLEAQGVDAFIVPFDVAPADLEDVLPRLQKLGNLRGCVVTIPHKERIAGLCHELGPVGRLAGAVNAVRFDPDGRRVGDNFDGTGFVQGGIASGIAFAGRRVLMLGAGGAAAAIAAALALEGVERLTIANRDHARAEALVARIRAGVPGAPLEAGLADARGHEVIVNATSLGMHAGDPLPLDPEGLAPSMQVYDIVTAVPETALMRAARARGCHAIGGRPMVDHQARPMWRFLGALPG